MAPLSQPRLPSLSNVHRTSFTVLLKYTLPCCCSVNPSRIHALDLDAINIINDAVSVGQSVLSDSNQHYPSGHSVEWVI